MTAFGVNTELEARPAHRALYGQLGYTRHFYSPTQQVAWHRGSLATHIWDTGEVPVVSVKSYSEADLTALMTEALGDFWLCYDHEPEARIAASPDPAAAAKLWCDTWGRLRTLRDSMPAAVAAKCHLVPILNRWQHVRAGFGWELLLDGCDLGDAIGVDSYAEAAQAAHGLYTPPDELLYPALALAGDLGTDAWCVPEFGAHVAAGDDGTRHGEYLRSVISASALAGAEWVSYWCNAKDGFHLDVPGQESGLAVWRTAVAATPADA